MKHLTVTLDGHNLFDGEVESYSFSENAKDGFSVSGKPHSNKPGGSGGGAGLLGQLLQGKTPQKPQAEQVVQIHPPTD